MLFLFFFYKNGSLLCSHTVAPLMIHVCEMKREMSSRREFSDDKWSRSFGAAKKRVKLLRRESVNFIQLCDSFNCVLVYAVELHEQHWGASVSSRRKQIITRAFVAATHYDILLGFFFGPIQQGLDDGWTHAIVTQNVVIVNLDPVQARHRDSWKSTIRWTTYKMWNIHYIERIRKDDSSVYFSYSSHLSSCRRGELSTH